MEKNGLELKAFLCKCCSPFMDPKFSLTFIYGGCIFTFFFFFGGKMLYSLAPHMTNGSSLPLHYLHVDESLVCSLTCKISRFIFHTSEFNLKC